MASHARQAELSRHGSHSSSRPSVRAMLTGHAERVLAAAQADPHDDSGAYEAGLHIEQATTDRARRPRCLLATLRATLSRPTTAFSRAPWTRA